MPWFRKSKKEGDDVSQQRRRTLPSQGEKGHESPYPIKEPKGGRKQLPRAKVPKEGKRERHYPHRPLFEYDYDSDEDPRRPLDLLVETSRERSQRLRDEREPPVPTGNLQRQFTSALKAVSPGQSQKTRIVVGIDFGTTCVAWFTRTV
jgi:hypothetical protein